MSLKGNAGLLPAGDVSNVRATPIPTVPMSPTPVREKNSTPVSQPDYEWTEREELHLREVEELKMRAAQMEKTMRWWSDCTANWREKWSKVRNERNKAYEENRQLRSKLDSLVKEATTLKREKHEQSSAMEQLKRDVEAHQTKGEEEGASQPSEQVTNTIGSNATLSETVSTTGSVQSSAGPDFLHRILQKNEGDVATDSLEKPKGKRKEESPASLEGHLLEEKFAMLQLKLEECQKTITAEREEKSLLVKSTEKLQQEILAHRSKYDDLKLSKQEVLLEMEKLKEEHQDELGIMMLELEDESVSRSSMDRRLTELRKELELMQAENAAEWGKRERLETDKQMLERENKKLRSKITEMDEQIERKNQQATAMIDSDLRTLQLDLSEKNKELNELRHGFAKLKKVHQDRITELEHMKRRAEQYEMEVKKLRHRIEELKRDLATAEDEVDVQTNNSRKLQRTNDQLEEQVETLQVQVEHLQSRLRRNNQPTAKSRSSSLKSFSMEDSTLPDSDEMAEEGGGDC